MPNKPPIIEMEASFSASERLIETRTTRAFDRALFWMLTGLLVFGVLAFGATEPWSAAVLQSGTVVLLLLWTARQMASQVAVFQPSALFAPMMLFAAVVIIQILSGLSAYRVATITEAMEYVSYAIILFITAQLFFYGQRLRLFADVLTWFGLVVSLLAILQSLTANGMLYWLRKPRFSSSIYGPYANRNHYAGLMEMLVPFALAVCFSRRASAGKKLAAGFAALLMSASLFLSGSRGGAAAFILEMIFLGVMNASLRKRTMPGFKTIILFAALVGFLVWIDVSPALTRWTAIEGDLQAGRGAIVSDCWRIFLQKPILGWGLGAFPYIYPQFRSFYTDYYINQAHNDLLQVMVETGVAGTLAMCWFIFALYRDALRRFSTRSTLDFGNSLRLAALTSCTGLLAHSLVDFNLHVPANAAMFFTMCALACWGHREESPGRPSAQRTANDQNANADE